MNDLIKYSKHLIDLKAEETIIEEAKKNPQKFEAIYIKYYKPLFRTILHKTQDVEITADLLSNVFCKALHNLHSFSYQGKSIYFWLYRIALNECAYHFRKTGKTQFFLLDHQLAENLSQELSKDDFNEPLKLALSKLSSGDLKLIDLRFFAGLKFYEIAEVVNDSEGNCKMRLYRALKKLKKHMGNAI